MDFKIKIEIVNGYYEGFILLSILISHERKKW